MLLEFLLKCGFDFFNLSLQFLQFLILHLSRSQPAPDIGIKLLRHRVVHAALGWAVLVPWCRGSGGGRRRRWRREGAGTPAGAWRRGACATRALAG